METVARIAPPKRPVRQLSVHEKLEAVQRVHEGESKASVARVIGVPESTLRGWCKNEDKLHAMANKESPSPEPASPGGPSESKRFAVDSRKQELDESRWFWLRNQQQQRQRVGGLDPLTTEAGGWFWRWYKHHYAFQTQAALGPVRPVEPKMTLDTVLLNLNDNRLEEAKENQSDEEDDPPETPAEALRHGHKFLRWLECCSDPSVTAVQLLQFRYLLNKVKACAERRATKARNTPRSKRK